ncbi:MAG: GerMN domain-containing protein [Actinomycetota bacterium]
MRRGRGGRRPLATLIGAVVALLVACGVPSEETPRDLAADSVQFDLLAPSSSTTSTTAPPDARRTVEIFLLRNEQLAPRDRQMPADTDPGDVIAELLIGPNDDERSRGFGTAIPDGTELIGHGLDDGTLTLNLTEELNTVQGELQTIAVAQMVFTATELDTVSGVRFQIEGTAVQVPQGDGTATSSPLTRADYPELDRDSD